MRHSMASTLQICFPYVWYLQLHGVVVKLCFSVTTTSEFCWVPETFPQSQLQNVPHLRNFCYSAIKLSLILKTLDNQFSEQNLLIRQISNCGRKGFLTSCDLPSYTNFLTKPLKYSPSPIVAPETGQQNQVS